VHVVVGYTDVRQLLPVYAVMVWVAVYLRRSRAWFFAEV